MWNSQSLVADVADPVGALDIVLAAGLADPPLAHLAEGAAVDYAAKLCPAPAAAAGDGTAVGVTAFPERREGRATDHVLGAAVGVAPVDPQSSLPLHHSQFRAKTAARDKHGMTHRSIKAPKCFLYSDIKSYFY